MGGVDRLPPIQLLSTVWSGNTPVLISSLFRDRLAKTRSSAAIIVSPPRGRPSPRMRRPVVKVIDHVPSPMGMVDRTTARSGLPLTPKAGTTTPRTSSTLKPFALKVDMPTKIARWLSLSAAASHSPVPHVVWSTSTASGQPRNTASGSAWKVSSRSGVQTRPIGP